MPEHPHVLVCPARGAREPHPIGEVLQLFKQHPGRHGKERLRAVRRKQGGLWSAPLKRWPRNEFDKQDVMNTRADDRDIFTE